MTGIPVAPGELVGIDYLNEVARAHYRKTTSKQVLNSVVETDLLNGEVTIGAGAMGTSRVLRLTARGDWAQNSGAARDIPRLKLKLGATTLIDTNVTGAAVAGVSPTREPWRVDATIHNLGATNVQWVSFESRIVYVVGAVAGVAGPGTGEGLTETTLGAGGAAATRKVDSDIGANGAVDTTVAQVLALTVINPTATATCEVVLTSALVEIV